jgi:pimeloyl-ACP methyl ester carboxylesterase
MAITAAAGMVLTVPLAGTATGATTAPAAAASIAWTPCPDNDPVLGSLLKGLECGTLKVPLDYAKPKGKQIKLALTRARHTSPESRYQGVVLLNRGGPGGFGRDLPTRFATGSNGLPTSVGSTYDWIGFDPRGVAGSEPKLACGASYLYPGKARPDYVPRSEAEERAWVRKAKRYAADCGRKYGDTLEHINTKNVARDMDAIRRALGQQKISYFGYSYGTYLGSVYASMFPQRVRRMVLDSVVRPSGVWYADNLDQNEAFEKRADIFFAWVAKWDSVYHLGKTRKEVEAAYYKGMAKVRKAPIDGKIGPAEYNDIFVPDAYRNYTWTEHAQILADWVLRGDAEGLRGQFGEPDWLAVNSYAIYSSVQCRDASWPRTWERWHADHSRQYRQGNRFLTWNNAWYNAPCAFWPVKSATPQKIGGGKQGPNILLVQPENDAATPVGGAYEVHRLFPSSRLVLEAGGNNHGASLSANRNACLNDIVSAYLGKGVRPSSKKGADATCAAMPAPDPTAATATNAQVDPAGEPLFR